MVKRLSCYSRTIPSFVASSMTGTTSKSKCVSFCVFHICAGIYDAHVIACVLGAPCGGGGDAIVQICNIRPPYNIVVTRVHIEWTHSRRSFDYEYIAISWHIPILIANICDASVRPRDQWSLYMFLYRAIWFGRFGQNVQYSYSRVRCWHVSMCCIRMCVCVCFRTHKLDICNQGTIAHKHTHAHEHRIASAICMRREVHLGPIHYIRYINLTYAATMCVPSVNDCLCPFARWYICPKCRC